MDDCCCFDSVSLFSQRKISSRIREKFKISLIKTTQLSVAYMYGPFVNVMLLFIVFGRIASVLLSRGFEDFERLFRFGNDSYVTYYFVPAYMHTAAVSFLK